MKAPTLRLHNYWRSSSSWRVRIALNYKGLPFAYLPVNLLEGQQLAEAYRATNPMQQVPTLEILDESGAPAVELTQSIAILEWLEETHPQPPLLPRDPLARARVRQLTEIVNSGIQPLQNPPVLRDIKRFGGDEKAWVRGQIEKGLRAIAALAQPLAGRFLVGDAPTFADVCLVPQLSSARRFGVELAELPLLERVERACLELEAFQAAAAERQPDAVK